MPTAKKAELKDSKIKIMIWGEPGAGKSRFGLSAPSPLVIDLEGSTRLYANEFDFWVAEMDKTNKEINTPVNLTYKIIQEIVAGEYKDRQTIVIDPVTDLLDNLETACLAQYEKQIGKSVATLNALEKGKWYSFRRDKAREVLNQIKDLPMNVILVTRTKNVWGKNEENKMAPIDKTYDALDIVESLMDVVIQLKKDGKDDVKAIVKKSRLGNLPDILDVRDYSSITKAIEEANTKKEVTLEKEKPDKTAKQAS